MRIGIVNDAPAITEILRSALALAPEHTVIWTAANAGEAVRASDRDAPDLVLMAVSWRDVDVGGVTRRVVTRAHCPILLVTSGVEADAARVFEAMGAGAFDAVSISPDAGSRDRAGAAPLLAKIATIARLARGADEIPAADANGPPFAEPAVLVAIGASAGGPSAVAALLGALPPDFPGAVVIVQHVDARFVPALGVWLDQQSAIPVRLAAENDRPAAAVALLAASNDHLVLKASDRFGYTPDPVSTPFRPSVDVLFHSIARTWRGQAVGVLLTGMGSDGAAGLKELRGKGHHTIAQDKASSAVYGMPKAAAAIGAATEVLPLKQIAERLVSLCVPEAKARVIR